MSVYDAQFPAKERKGSVIEMLALDLAAARAAETKDSRLVVVAAAAYSLLGWGWWYLAEEISILGREEGRRWVESGSSHKNRRLLRAEARGFARCLQMLEGAGLLTERELHEARNGVWIRNRDLASTTRPEAAPESVSLPVSASSVEARRTENQGAGDGQSPSSGGEQL